MRISFLRLFVPVPHRLWFMMKAKIAVVATTTAINPEKGLNRMFFLAELLGKNGYEVDFITSDFQHWSKDYRVVEDVKKYSNYCNIVLLHETGYKKNIDVRRIYSHYVLAKNIGNYLKTKEYDLIYSDLPDNHVAAICGKYAKKRGIPFVADVEDLWPKAMRMVFDVPVLSDIAFYYFSHDAKLTYKLCSAIVGSSDTYRDDPLNYGIEKEKKITVYVGTDIKKFDDGAAENARYVIKNDDEFWVTYAGTLGTSYDLKTFISTADIIRKKGKNNIKFLLLGDGPLRKELELLAQSLTGEVRFLGYMPFEKMAGYLVKSDLVVNSVRKDAPQSIVSKIGDYLASGKPMINTCVDPEFWKKVEQDNFGINVEPGNPALLAESIIDLETDKEKCKTMSENARRIGEEQFDRSYAFMKIVKLIDELLSGKSK